MVRVKLTVHLGPMAMDVMRLENLESPRCLRVRALPDEQLTFTYTLEEENQGTCVRLVMDGFEAMPEEVREGHVRQSNSGWEKTLKNLKAYSEGATLPFPQAYEEARWGAMEQNTFGFGMVLQNVKAFVEGKSLPFPGGF